MFSVQENVIKVKKKCIIFRNLFSSISKILYNRQKPSHLHFGWIKKYLWKSKEHIGGSINFKYNYSFKLKSNSLLSWIQWILHKFPANGWNIDSYSFKLLANISWPHVQRMLMFHIFPSVTSWELDEIGLLILCNGAWADEINSLII